VLVAVTVRFEPPEFIVTVPVPVPAPVAVNDTPTAFELAPIKVKSVVPTVRIVTSAPEVRAVAAAVAVIVAAWPVASPWADEVFTVAVVPVWLIEMIVDGTGVLVACAEILL